MDIVGTVTLPARLGIRVTLWGVRTVSGFLPVRGQDGDEATPPGPVEEAPQPAPAETVARPAAPEPPRPEPEAEEPELAGPEPADSEPVEPDPVEPAHVDEGSTLVAEFAEDGAEDGVGAEIELSEPWEGYDRLHADELVDRLGAASSEELAAVVLYEHSNRKRASVIGAAERQLRARSAPGSRM